MAALAAVIFAVRLLFPSDETKIRKVFRGVAETASFSREQSGLVRLARINRITSFFAPDVVLTLEGADFEGGQVNGREELRQGLAGAQRSLRSLEVQFEDLSVGLNAARDRATVQLALLAHINEERNSVVQALKVSLQKDPEKRWLIDKVETVRVLGR